MNIVEMKALLAEQVNFYINIAKVPEYVAGGNMGIGGCVDAKNFVCHLYDILMKYDYEPPLREALKEMHGLLVIELFLRKTPLREDIERIVEQGWQFYPKQEQHIAVVAPQTLWDAA